MKRALAAAVLALALGAGALALTFRAERLPVPPLRAATLPKANPPAEMTLSALRTGFMPSIAAFAYRGGGWRDTRDFTIRPGARRACPRVGAGLPGRRALTARERRAA